MRRRAFWIALPIAIVFALWAGPGLSEEDKLPPPAVAEPLVEPPPEPEALPELTLPAPQSPVYPQCDEPADPGPDGDQ